MPTFLFSDLVFGPVKSRRLGISLGINLLPTNSKFCNFDCIYCECGWNAENPPKSGSLPTREDVYNALKSKLIEMRSENVLPNAITFAGNGEPTLHPQFPEIVDDCLSLKNEFAPEAKLSVLTNGTRLQNEQIINALSKVDNPILKLDSAIFATRNLINQPKNPLSTEMLVELLAKVPNAIIQILFLRGTFNSQVIDNTTVDELFALKNALKKIQPRDIMCYSLDRDTPAPNLEKISQEELSKIRDFLLN